MPAHKFFAIFCGYLAVIAVFSAGFLKASFILFQSKETDWTKAAPASSVQPRQIYAARDLGGRRTLLRQAENLPEQKKTIRKVL
jgi:hypothetical protein